MTKKWSVCFASLILSVLSFQPPIHTAPPNAVQNLQQGKQYYQAGQLVKAAEILQKAASDFASQGDTLNQAITLANLSLVLQQLGQWQPATTAIDTSLKLLNSISQRDSRVVAQVLNIQGRLQLSLGQSELALETWQEATKCYQEAGDFAGTFSSQINQAQALQSLGLYRQALKTLEPLLEMGRAQPDPQLKATGLRSLGEALRVVGDLQQSQTVLQESLEIAQNLKAPQLLSETWLSLGNTTRTQQDIPTALNAYNNAANTAILPLTRLQAQLNQLRLLLETQQWQTAQTLVPQILPQLENIPLSRMAIYARVNLAESLMQLEGELENALELLTVALQQARQLQDMRAEAYTLGRLGEIYQQNQQLSRAQQFTEQALFLSQALQASDLAYQWQWQLGRLLKTQGQTEAAIAAYTEAVNTLKSLRIDLVAVNPDVQFSFRDSVEPVYRELVSLILQPSDQQFIPSQKNLRKARELIESLQLAELDNFFREACLDTEIKPQAIDQIDPEAAVIYPIILADRIAVIVSLPGQPLRYHFSAVSSAEVETIIAKLQQSFRPIFSTQDRLALAQQVYNWLIRPAEADLAQNSIQTLVFVLDGALRNLPMAALFDGKQYLIEQYNIAVTPGLQLLAPRSLASEKLKALTVGLSEARQGFEALPAVKFELDQIQAQVPAQVLFNQDFTRQSFQKQLRQTSFEIVHLATHGQFSSRADETFLLTWEGRINVKDLDQLLRSRELTQLNPIELLVLSACQTATGDQRAALGLAGVAVRSGARSTLATLWQVNDVSTAIFMAEFYQELTQPGVSKTEAVRLAQLKLLQDSKYNDPYYWAAFVLIGNWL